MEVLVTTGAIRRAKLQSNHHQQINTQFFTGWMPFLSTSQRCWSTEGKLTIITARCKSATVSDMLLIRVSSDCGRFQFGSQQNRPTDLAVTD